MRVARRREMRERRRQKIPAARNILPTQHDCSETTQDGTIFSSAGRLRIMSVDPFRCSNCLFLNSANRRLTVSRVVPIISAISSSVNVSLTCIEPSFCAFLLDQERRRWANFSEGEVARPSVRILRKRCSNCGSAALRPATLLLPALSGTATETPEE